MDKNLNILIDSNGISISTSRSLVEIKHYLEIIVIYSHVDSVLTIKHLQSNYYRGDLRLHFDLEDEIEISLGDLKTHYQNSILQSPHLKKDLQIFVGHDDYHKFISYYITGISLILSLFGLLSQDKETLMLHPLQLVFPDLKIDIDMLNPKLYYFLTHYIEAMKSMNQQDIDREVIKPLLEFIDDYFVVMKDYLKSEESDSNSQNQEMLCIHSSTLGYGKYLELRFKQLSDEAHKFSSDLNMLAQDKQRELKKYYNDEILSIAEQTATIKNINLELITDTTNFIKRSKDEIILHSRGIKESLEKDSRKKLEDFINEKNKEISDHYSQVSKKSINELTLTVINLENQQVQKIKSSLDAVLDTKNGVLKDIDDLRVESLSEINDLRVESKNEVIKIKDTLLEDLNSLHNSSIGLIKDTENKFRTLEKSIEEKLQKIEAVTTNLNQIKDNKFNLYLHELWGKLEPDIRKQIKDLIRSTIEESLESLGLAIDEQINKKIDAKLRSLKK